MAQACSPYTTPLFQVAAGDQRRFASLNAILTDPKIDRFDYPFSAMNSLATLLATGLTRALLVEHDETLDSEQWLSLISSEAQTPSHLLSRFPTGFELYGDIAFMQFPAQVFSADKAITPVGDLFLPFVIGGETTKGLHHISRRIRRVCNACALMGLYGQHTLSGTVGKHWSVAQTKESQIATLSFPGKPLAQTIWANQLLLKPEAGKHVSALPWIPDNTENRGLNRDGSLPFEPWLRDQCCLNHPLTLYFPLIRCLRLQHQTVNHEDERCDLCRTLIHAGYSIVTGYQSLDEETLFKRLKPDTREAMQRGYAEYQKLIDVKKKTKKECTAVDFKRLYDPAARHPHLLYQTSRESTRPYPVNVNNFSTNVTQRRPVWSWLLAAEQGNLPTILRQLHNLEAPLYDSAAIARIKRLKDCAAIGLFGVRFKQGRDVSLITHTMLHFAEIEGVLNDADQKKLVRYAAPIITLIKDAIIPAFEAAAKVLGSSYEFDSTKTKYKLKAPSKNTPTDHESPHLLDCAETLWRMAFEEIIAISQCSGREEKVTQKNKSINNLEKRAKKLWDRYLQQQAMDHPSLAELFIENEASTKFNRQLRKGVKQIWQTQ